MIFLRDVRNSKDMQSNQNVPDDNYSGRLTFFLIVYLGIFLIIGVFGVWLTSDLTVLLTWFWIGVGVLIIYLLYKIAKDVHQLTYEH